MSNTCQICQIRVKFCLRFFGPSVKLDPRRQSVKTDPDAIPSVKPSKPIRARSPLSNRRACCQIAERAVKPQEIVIKSFMGPRTVVFCIDLDRALQARSASLGTWLSFFSEFARVWGDRARPPESGRYPDRPRAGHRKFTGQHYTPALRHSTLTLARVSGGRAPTVVTYSCRAPRRAT